MLNDLRTNLRKHVGASGQKEADVRNAVTTAERAKSAADPSSVPAADKERAVQNLAKAKAALKEFENVKARLSEAVTTQEETNAKLVADRDGLADAREHAKEKAG